MAQTQPLPRLVVGIDIAATTFTASWAHRDAAPRRAQTFAQEPSGFLALHNQLAAAGADPATTLVVLEATSSYWISLAVYLHEAGYQLSVVNPRHVQAYAQSLPRRAKTDPRDAQLLVQFGHDRATQLLRWTPPPSVYHELRQRLSVRASLQQLRGQAANQRHALVQWPVQIASALEPLNAVIADLDTRIATLEREIATVLRDGAWAASAALLTGIKGIGTLTASWLLVTTLNFQLAATPEALAAYAGLVPLPHESGSSVRKRRQIGHQGNQQLRTSLYLATLSAAQHNPLIKPFYARLRAAGKPMKVARCAAARKLLRIAWAVVSNGKPFDPAYGSRPATPAGVAGLLP